MIIKLIYKQSYAKGSLPIKKENQPQMQKKKINDKKKERKLPISSHPSSPTLSCHTKKTHSLAYAFSDHKKQAKTKTSSEPPLLASWKLTYLSATFVFCLLVEIRFFLSFFFKNLPERLLR